MWNKWGLQRNFFFGTKKKKKFYFLLPKLIFLMLLFWNTWELILVLMQPPRGSFLKKLDEFMERFGTFHESKSKQKKIGIEASVKPFSYAKNENVYFFAFGASWVQKFFFVFFFPPFSATTSVVFSAFSLFCFSFFFLFKQWVIFVSEVCCSSSQ